MCASECSCLISTNPLAFLTEVTFMVPNLLFQKHGALGGGEKWVDKLAEAYVGHSFISFFSNP